MTTDLDAELRDALTRDVSDLQADDDLLDRIRQQVGSHTRRSRARRSAPWILAAAAAAAVAVLAGVLLIEDDPQQVDTVDEPSTTTTDAPTTTDASTTTSPPTPAARPTEAVAVTEDGRLVVISVPSSEELRQLAAFDDPRERPAEGTPFSISGVALHPNDRDVYFETCCEPASGQLYRVPLDGSSEPEQVMINGSGIDISADGRWLAYTFFAGFALENLETGETLVSDLQPSGVAAGFVRIVVNHDGSEVAVEEAEFTEGGEISESRLLVLATTDLATPVDEVGGDGRDFGAYIDSGRTLAVIQPDTDAVDLNVDASGSWDLVTAADGLLYSSLGDPPTDVGRIPGSFIAADW